MASGKEATFVMRLEDLVSSPLKAIASIAGDTTKKLRETVGAAAQLGKGGGLGGGMGGNVLTKIKSSLGGLSNDLREAAGEVPGLNRAIGLVTNPYVAVSAGIVAVGAAAANATGRAMAFEQGIAKINTTARLSTPELTSLRQQLMTMGANSTVPLQEIPDAFNQIISAVGDTNKALDIFQPALRASQAGFTDIRTIADSVTNVMGAVGKATPTKVFDTLFASVRLGKGEFKEFANYLPRIIPMANNVGIKYQEVAGAFALMTANGQSAEQTTVLLQNAMQSLGKSEVIYGSKSVKGFKRSGIEIYDHAGQMRGLIDIVGDLSKKTTGMTDKQRQAFLAGLGLDQQAASSFSILAQNAKKLREFVGGTTNSAGEMEAAYKRSLNPAARLKILVNQWQELMTNIGYKILPYVNKALEVGLDFVAKIKANSEGLSNYFGAAVAPIRLMWSGLKGVWNILSWISDLSGGSMGSLIEQLFGGSSNVWQDIKAFLSNFLEGINITLNSIDDLAEGNYQKAGQRLAEFQAKISGNRQVNNVLQVPGQGPVLGKTWLDNYSLQLPGNFSAKDDKKKDAPGLTTSLNKQSGGADIQGDNKARIVNTRIDKVEVIVKVASAAGRSLDEIGNHVASIIVGSVRDSEIILSNG